MEGGGWSAAGRCHIHQISPLADEMKQIIVVCFNTLMVTQEYSQTCMICSAVCLGVSRCGVCRKGLEGASSPLSLYTHASLSPGEIKVHILLTVKNKLIMNECI